MSRRFEQIRFVVQGRQTLLKDLEQWNEILAVDGRERYVHQVKIVGYMPRLQMNEAGEGTEVAENYQPDIIDDEDDENEDETEIDEGDCLKASNGFMEKFTGAASILTDQEKQVQNEAWLPLARFLARLSGLKDLIYAAFDQVPTCILSSLQQHHPSSRLHVHTFSLRSLFQLKDRSQDIDPDEYVLTTSPCLYSMVVLYSDYDTLGRVNYNEKAVLKMAAGVAPNLKSVRMWYRRPGASLALKNAVRTPKPPWQGFFVSQESTEPTRSKGHLQKLALDGGGSTNSAQLITWSDHTDFSQLHSLEIRNEVRLEALRTLTRIAANGGFESLRMLALFVSPLESHEQPHMDEAASLLLQKIDPLESLELSGFIADRTFTVALHHHGATLRKLQFFPAREHRMQVEPYVISHHCIQELQKRCPNLRETELLIARTQGDEQEVKIYRALGKLPRLERASVVLDCWQPQGVSLDDASRHTEPQVSRRLREDLINSAIDSSLALAIFHAISSSTLQRLTLRVSAGGGGVGQEWCDVDFSNIRGWIARSWVVCKRKRDSAAARGAGSGEDEREEEEEITVREIEKGERKMLIETEWLEDDLEAYYDGKIYKRVWSELWPDAPTEDGKREREGDAKGKWSENWRSFPLSLGSV